MKTMYCCTAIMGLVSLLIILLTPLTYGSVLCGLGLGIAGTTLVCIRIMEQANVAISFFYSVAETSLAREQELRSKLEKYEPPTLKGV